MKKYYIKTYGCQMNELDSERIASFLENKGYKSVKGADLSAEALAKADLVVVNACSVRQTAIDRILGLKLKIRKLQKTNPKLQTILTGCVLKSDKKKFKEFFDEIVPLSHFFHDRRKVRNDYFSIKPKCEKKNSAFVPIMTGCDNFCSYCVVPYVRGREKSRPASEIINEIKSLIKKGYKEITLLGQNVNSYSRELFSVTENSSLINFVELLKIINKISGKFKIKFLTNHPKDFSDELIDTIADCKKIAKEIHLPIQSGDNQILKKMNRGYTIEQYKNLVKKIRKKIPNVKFSTDVIVGFPGETKKQFENTVKLFKEIKFDKAYINKYSPRAGTAAFKFEDNVPWEEKKRRWKILNDIINKKQKLIVVLGPTASGKSDLAIQIAKDFNGEIVSADSRQVYKGMDIGTAKPFQKGVPHYCLDIASPKRQLTVIEYRKKALKAIDKICKKNKIPILCGGTGFYIQAVSEGMVIPEVKPDPKLRKELESKTTEQLFNELKKLDQNRAKTIDSKNKRRLIRALEIVLKTDKTVPQIKEQPQFDVLYIGIKKSLPGLKKAIDKRVDKMIKMGLMKEINRLINKYGQTIVLKNTIGYKEWLPYYGKTRQKLRILTGPPACPNKLGLAAGKLKKEIISAIKLHSLQFAKRQRTWFRRNKKIHWINNYQEAKKLLLKFLF